MRDHSRALRSFLSAHSTFAPRRQPYHMLIEGINMEIILEIGIYKKEYKTAAQRTLKLQIKHTEEPSFSLYDSRLAIAVRLCHPQVPFNISTWLQNQQHHQD